MPKGFTLIEILITLGIISMVTLVAIPNFRRFNTEQQLQKDVKKLVAAIRQVQANAQNKVTCQASRALSWSIQFDSNGYTVKADCETGSDYTAPAVEFVSTMVSTNCGANSPVIQFSNGSVAYPDATVCPDLGSQIFSVTLTSTVSNQTSVVKIDKGGAIYEE